MRNHKQFIPAVLLGLGACASTTIAETTKATLLKAPPVTVGSAVWLQRGVQGERTLLMTKVEGLEGELQETRNLQTQLADRLAQALEKLNRSETEQHSSNELRSELGNAQKNLKNFQYQLENLESRSLQQERENIAVRQLLEKEKMILQGELQKQLHMGEKQVTRIGDLEKQLQVLDASKAKLTALTTDLKTKLENEKTRASKLEDQVTALTTSREKDEGRHRLEIEKMTQSMADSQEGLSSLREQLRTLQGVRDTEATTIDSLKGEKGELQAKIKQLEGSLAGGENNISDMGQELEGLRNTLQAKQTDHLAQLEIMIKELATLREGETTLRDAKSALQTQLDEEVKKVTSLNTNLSKWKSTADQLSKEKAARKIEATQLQSTLSNREKALNTLQAQLSDITEIGVATNRAFALQIDSLKEQMGSLKASEQWFEAKTEELTSQMEKGKNSYKTLEESFTKAQAEITSRDTQLNTMRQQVEEAQATAQQREAELNSQLKGLKTDAEKIRIAMQDAAENLAAATAERNQMSLQVQEYENRLQKQKGQVNRQQNLLANLKQTMLVAEKNASAIGISNGKSITEKDFNRMTALTEKLDRHAKMLEQSRTKTSSLEQQLLRAEGDLSRARRDQEKLQKKVNRSRSGKADRNLQAKLDDAQSMLEKATSFEKHAREKIQSLNRTLAITREQLARNDADIGKLTTSVKEKENEVSRLRQQELTAPSSNANAMTEEIRNLKSALQEKNLALSALTKRLQRQSTTENPDSNEALRTLQNKLMRAEREIKSYEKTTDLLRKSIEESDPTPQTKKQETPEVDALKKQLLRETQQRLALDKVLREKSVALQKLREQLKRTEPRPTPEPTPSESSVTDVAKAQPAEPVSKKDATSTPAKKTYTQLTAEANVLHEKGDVTEAMDTYKKAIELAPNKTSARLGLAGALYAIGNIIEAKTQVDTLLKIDSNNPQALGLKSIIYWAEGNISQANTLITQAIKQNKNDPQLYNYYGIIAHSRDRKQEAISALEKAIQLDPDHREAHFNLAVMYATMDPPNLDQARRRYKSALNLGSARDESLEQVLIP